MWGHIRVRPALGHFNRQKPGMGSKLDAEDLSPIECGCAARAMEVVPKPAVKMLSMHQSMHNLLAPAQSEHPVYTPLEEEEEPDQGTPACIIRETDTPKERWDLLVMCCIFYSALIVPLRLCFHAEAEGLVWDFEASMSLIFLTDLCLSFNTAYLSEGEWVTSRRKIASRYLRSWFWIDAPSSLPVEFIEVLLPPGSDTGALPAFRILRMLRLVRMLRLLKVGVYVARLEEELEISLRPLRVVELVVQMLFIAHMLACGWFTTTWLSPPRDAASAASEDDEGLEWSVKSAAEGAAWEDDPTYGLTWIERYDHGSAADGPVSRQYFLSLYWAICTLFAINPIPAATDGERKFVMVRPQTATLRALARPVPAALRAWLRCSHHRPCRSRARQVVNVVNRLLLAYIVGKISSLIAQLDRQAAMVQDKLDMLNEYLQVRAVHMLCPSLHGLLSPSLASSHLLSPSLAFSRLLSPPLASSRLLSPSLTFTHLLWRVRPTCTCSGVARPRCSRSASSDTVCHTSPHISPHLPTSPRISLMDPRRPWPSMAFHALRQPSPNHPAAPTHRIFRRVLLPAAGCVRRDGHPLRPLAHPQRRARALQQHGDPRQAPPIRQALPRLPRAHLPAGEAPLLHTRRGGVHVRGGRKGPHLPPRGQGRSPQISPDLRISPHLSTDLSTVESVSPRAVSALVQVDMLSELDNATPVRRIQTDLEIILGPYPKQDELVRVDGVGCFGQEVLVGVRRRCTTVASSNVETLFIERDDLVKLFRQSGHAIDVRRIIANVLAPYSAREHLSSFKVTRRRRAACSPPWLSRG